MLIKSKILFSDTKITETRHIKLKHDRVYIYDKNSYQFQYEAYKIHDPFERIENKYKYKIVHELISNKWTRINGINIMLVEIEYTCEKCKIILSGAGDDRPYKCGVCYEAICYNCEDMQRCNSCDNMICDKHELTECELCEEFYCDNCGKCNYCR
jgi:hypothetical protein